MNRCAAAWFELNMSGPDNRVTACCYYAGYADEWGDQSKTLDDYWNSPAMRALRKLQTNPAPPKSHGCSSCHLYENQAPGYERYDFNSGEPPLGMSPRQQANWHLAEEEYRSGAEVLACRPIRIYANFGFGCNISCTMCHQVPRRLDNRRTMSAEQLLSWGDDLEQARQMIVIGGEPFVLPEAVKFIRRFVADEQRYESVQLVITTNATVLHKHWDVLHRKRRMNFAISLDGIGEAFERVRLGARWQDVERNVLRLLEARATDRPEWELCTASLIQRSTLENLPEFARWHARHGLGAVFSDFISAPGVEDTYHRENFLHNPELLGDLPQWREYFDEAISVFASAGQVAEVDSLTHFRERVERSVANSGERIQASRVRRLRNDWRRVAPASDVSGGADASFDWSVTLTSTPAAGRDAVPLGHCQGMQAFTRTRLGDFLATPYIGLQAPLGGGSFRIRFHWSRFDLATEIVRRAHVAVQREDGSELVAFREGLDFELGSDLILSGAIPSEVQAIRVVISPVGEEISLVPKRVEFDFDSETVRAAWPAEAIVAPSVIRRFGLAELWTIVSGQKNKHKGMDGIRR